jgi:hypothetical protein
MRLVTKRDLVNDAFVGELLTNAVTQSSSHKSRADFPSVVTHTFPYFGMIRSSPAPRTQSPPPSRPRQRKMFLEYVPTLSSQKKAKFVECRTEDAHLAASGEMTHAWVNTAALTPAEFATVQSQTALAPSPSFPSSIPTQFDDACDSPYNSDTSLEDYSWVQPRPTHPVAHFLCPQTETQHFYPAAACVSHYGATYPESWNSYHQFKSDLPTNATDYLDDPGKFLFFFFFCWRKTRQWRLEILTHIPCRALSPQCYILPTDSTIDSGRFAR